jgi:rieske iron-sulfur protein
LTRARIGQTLSSKGRIRALSPRVGRIDALPSSSRGANVHGRNQGEGQAPSGADENDGGHAPARRRLLGAALLTGASFALLRAARADDEKPGAEERPQPGDLFVFSEDENAGKTVTPGALPVGGPPALAWPMDPRAKVVRDGSRLNQVLLLRLDPASLDPDARAYAADGIVAFSAVCTHAGCPVTGWIKDGDKTVLKCFCHNSEYDPRQQAKVVFGPAPRHLALLPVKIADGALTAAGGFIGKVGPTQSG